MLKLKLQNFGHLMQRANSLEKTLMLGKIQGGKRRGWQRTRWLDSIINSIAMSLSTLWEIVRDRDTWYATSPWGRKESDMTERLNKNKPHEANWLPYWTVQIQNISIILESFVGLTLWKKKVAWSGLWRSPYLLSLLYFSPQLIPHSDIENLFDVLFSVTHH